MLTFKNITVRDAAMLRRYYENCDYALCEYSAGVKLMWRSALRYAWAEAAGCLIIRCESEGRVSFDYPVAGPDGDEDAALSAIEAYCMETGIQPEISIVPEEKAPVLLSRYPYVRVSNIRTWRDYLYYKEDLQLFAGRRYSGQRNHIKKFYAQWPNAEFRPISVKADAGAIEQFWVDFKAEFPKDSGSKAMAELELSKKMMAMPDKPWLLRGGMFDGEKLIALSLCEKCGETLIIHIEKALYSYAGAYPAMVQAEVAAFGDGCAYVNREDDAGDRGLRTSKLQYLPVRLAGKLRFEVRCEADRLREIPTVTTPRLTLTPLEERDEAAYNALCLDDARNRWWGYDYRQDLKGELTEDYFLSVARRDFAARRAVNFAVRLDRQLIGEVVLYRFDWRGGAELGCRIDPAYAGHGYGTEAFAAAADWALFRLSLARVKAKCYKENAASYKMLSACMRPAGEDETFFYFEKTV